MEEFDLSLVKEGQEACEFDEEELNELLGFGVWLTSDFLTSRCGEVHDPQEQMIYLDLREGVTYQLLGTFRKSVSRRGVELGNGYLVLGGNEQGKILAQFSKLDDRRFLSVVGMRNQEDPKNKILGLGALVVREEANGGFKMEEMRNSHPLPRKVIERLVEILRDLKGNTMIGGSWEAKVMEREEKVQQFREQADQFINRLVFAMGELSKLADGVDTSVGPEAVDAQIKALKQQVESKLEEAFSSRREWEFFKRFGA